MNNALMTILSLSVSGSVLGLIVLAGKPLLKNRVSKAFSYYIWVLVLLRLIVPLAAPDNATGSLFGMGQAGANDSAAGQAEGPLENAAARTAVSSNTQAAPTGSQDNKTAGTPVPTAAHASFNIWSFIKSNILWIWLAGAAASLGWFVTAYACFSRRIRRSCVSPHGDDFAVFERVRGKNRICMACSSHVDVPMLLGVLRPVIVLPQLAYVQNGMERELMNILRHELTHHRRKDVLYKWLVVAATSFHWFNPLMPLFRREISRACELSCDEAVIGGMTADEKQSYGNTLLALSANRKLPPSILATTLCEGKKELKERLVGIMRYKKKSAWAVALTFILALLLAGCAAVMGVPKSLAPKSAANEIVSENNALRTALAQNTAASTGHIAVPFQAAAGGLLKSCSFPVYLPTYLPDPQKGNEWKTFPEIHNGSFSIEIDQLPIGDTGQVRSNAEWFGVLSADTSSAGPTAPPLMQQFQNTDTQVNSLVLPGGIVGKEYINDPNVASGTAITWQTGNWSFFVTAYPESEANFSTTHYADEIVNALKDSGQALPGLRGKFDFIYNGNMPMTEVYWEVKDSVWYELDTRLPADAIKILQSMKILDATGQGKADETAPPAPSNGDPAVSEQLKAVLSKYTTDQVTFFQSLPVGGNQNAAFAMAGGNVWYITASGAEKLKSGIPYLADIPSYAPVIWTVGDTEIFKCENGGGGSSSDSYAWYVKNGKPVELPNTGMGLTYTGNGQFTTIGSAFDSNNTDGIAAGHTYKIYYLYWSADGLKEYGGLKITQQQLLKAKGAQAILDAITKTGFTVDDIYYRANNIININYHSGDQQNGSFGNMTLVYQDGAVTPELINMPPAGPSSESLNGKDLSNYSYGGIYCAALFPQNATYPDNFPLGS